MSKIRVRMPEGTSHVSVGGQSYEPDAEGVVTLLNPEHVAPLVAAGGVQLGDDGEPGKPPALIGSDHFPDEVKITEDGEPRQLSAIVAEAQATTQISAVEWNNLPQRVRDLLIGFQIAQERGDLGNVREAEAARDTAISERDGFRDQVQTLQERVTTLEGDLEAARTAATAAAGDGGKGGEQKGDAPEEKADAAGKAGASKATGGKGAEAPKG